MEMDELKLKLSTKFMRGIVAELVSKAIFKKLGYKIDIQLHEIDVAAENGAINLHVNVDAKVDNDEFMTIIKSIGLK
jgi:hypothetical protein